MRVTPPVHRTPHGQSAGPRHSDPGKGSRPQFRCHQIPFDASSVVHCRSSLQSRQDVLISRLLTVTFTTAAFRTEAAYGCLKPAPEMDPTGETTGVAGKARAPQDHCAVSMLAIGASRRVTATSSISKSFLVDVPVGMGAAVSIPPFPDLARGPGEAAPFGAASRPTVHGHGPS